VQGEFAERSVAAAIGTLARRSDVDVVVVIRGGGARNELATFDAEQIATAIAVSHIPVLTGLGHEIDVSVADEVAHRSLKTPTACAGALIEMVLTYRDTTERRWSAIESLALRRLTESAGSLSDRAHRIARRTHAAVERADERLATRRERLRTVPLRQLQQSERELDTATSTLVRRVPHVLAEHSRRLDSAASRLALLDPVNLLRRGWSITRGADGSVLRSVEAAVAGELITTQVADGSLTSRIEET
jgi:exodeoxyribonuclease VII large subunit